jgi:hypothetical protein
MTFIKHISSINLMDNQISKYFWRNVKLENLGLNCNNFMIFSLTLLYQNKNLIYK